MATQRMADRTRSTAHSDPADSGPAGGTRQVLGGYREYAPPPLLAGCVESLWTHQTPRRSVVEAAAHRVLPDLGISLAFQGFRRDNGEPFEWAPIIVGPKRHAQIFDLVPGRELAAIRIKPEWCGPLLGIDPMALEDRIDNLIDVLPRLGTRVGDELSRTRSAAAALHTLVAALRRAHDACRARPSALTSAALDIVRGTSGAVSCERVATTLGCSGRHVRRHVHDATGIAPKTYARSLRFVAAMLIADDATRPAWADIALQAGYFDQSHLIRDAVALTGVSPRELHVERRRQVVGGLSVLSNRS
jgi:AraC-like DNA-binding protein